MNDLPSQETVDKAVDQALKTKIPPEQPVELTEEQQKRLDDLKAQQFQSSITGRRIYGPRKLKLIQQFFGELQQLERRGLPTRYVLKLVMGKKKGRRGFNTLECYTTKQISGLISQLKGF